MSTFGDQDVFVSKLDSSGNFVWAKQMGGAGGDTAWDMALTTDGGVCIAGQFASASADFDPGAGTFNLSSLGGSDIFVAKLNSSGSLVWARAMGGQYYDDMAMGVAVGPDGSIYTTGQFNYDADFDPGAGAYELNPSNGVVFVSKLNAAGNFVWARNMASGDAVGYDIAVGSDGCVYTAGYFFDGAPLDFDPGQQTYDLISAGVEDVFVSKLDASGNFVGARRLGGLDQDIAWGIAVASDGSVYTTGAFHATADFNPGPATFNLASNGAYDIFVSKLDFSDRAPSVSGADEQIYIDGTFQFSPAYFTSRFSDPDAGDALQTVKITSLPTHGELTLNGADVQVDQEIPIDQVGGLLYTAQFYYKGPDSFTWNGSEGLAYAAASATITITTVIPDMLSLQSSSGIYPSESIATGRPPISLCTGDFNGDGAVDFIAANYTDDTLSLLLGDGRGGYPVRIDYPNGYGAGIIEQVVAADLNNDNKLDLVTMAYPGLVSVWMGNGDGTFKARVDYAFGAYVDMGAILASDLNGDHVPDLVVSNDPYASDDDALISILIGNGDGTFRPRVDYVTDGRAMSLVAGDFNGDSKVDLVGGTGRELIVIWGAGNGAFGSPVNPGFWGPTGCLAAADVNGDHNLDLVTAGHGSTSGEVCVLLNDGHGGLAKAYQYSNVGDYPSALVVRDLNGDGRIDVAISAGRSNTGYVQGNSNVVVVMLGNGDGSLRTGVSYTTDFSPLDMVAVDVNDDGVLDLAATVSVDEYNGYLHIDNCLFILRGCGDGTFASRADYAAGANSCSMAVADVNNDGLKDVIVVNSNDYGYNNATISVLLGNGDGAFQPRVSYPVLIGANRIVVGDFNNDGKQDAVVADSSWYGQVLLGDGNGGFLAEPTLYSLGFSPWGLATADVNGDGKLDLISSNSGENNVAILLGNGDGTFQGRRVFTTIGDPESLTLADVNNDGKIDIVAAGFGNKKVSILLGNGDGTFRAKVDYATASQPQAVTTGDFNGDGNLDIATANQRYISYNGQDCSTISVLLGNGDGTFLTHVDSPLCGIYALSICAADFDGDGNIDLAANTSAKDGVSILAGRGDGTFAPAVSYRSGAGPEAVAVADVDNDGSPELLSLNDIGSTVSVFRRLGAGAFPDDFVPGNPGKPSASQITSDGARIDWSTAVDPDGQAITYELQYRRAYTSDAWTSVGTTADTHLSISGLSFDTQYSLRVIARDATGESGWVEDTTGFFTAPQDFPPSNPGTLSHLLLDIGVARIDWGASVDSDYQPITYEVQYKRASTLDSWTSAGTTSDTRMTISGLTPETDYDVRVIARDTTGESDWVPYSFNSGSAVAMLSNPGVPSVSQITSNSALVSWDSAKSENDWAICYYVWYAPAAHPEDMVLCSMTNDAQCLVTNLEPNTTYNVFVQAGDGMFTSDMVEGAQPFTTFANAGQSQSDVTIGLGQSAGAIKYTEPDGTVVTITLKNATARIVFDSDVWIPSTGKTLVIQGQASVSEIAMLQGGTAGALTITTKGGDSHATIGKISGEVPMAAITAATTDLTGSLTIGASADPKAAVSLKFDEIHNADITSYIPIKSLTATEWLDDDGIADVLTAPAVGTISMKGRKANLKTGVAASRGDFEADLNLGDLGNTVLALKSLTVAGMLDGSTITANVYDLKGVSIGAIKAGLVGDATVVADGGVTSISTSQWQAGSIEAGWVGSVASKANKTFGTVGNFGADLVLTGNAVPLRKSTLGSASIAGDLLAGTCWDVQAGLVGSLTFSGTVRQSLIRSAWNVKSITVGASDGSDFGAGVPMDLLESSRHVEVGDLANSPKATIGTFTVRGLKLPKGSPIPRFFVDSCISAGVGKLNLLNWDDQGGLFAPADDVGSVRHKDSVDKTNYWVWPAPPTQVSGSPDEFIHII